MARSTGTKTQLGPSQLRELREELGLSRARAAELLHMNASTIWRSEQEGKDLDDETRRFIVNGYANQKMAETNVKPTQSDGDERDPQDVLDGVIRRLRVLVKTANGGGTVTAESLTKILNYAK